MPTPAVRTGLAIGWNAWSIVASKLPCGGGTVVACELVCVSVVCGIGCMCDGAAVCGIGCICGGATVCCMESSVA